MLICMMAMKCGVFRKTMSFQERYSFVIIGNNLLNAFSFFVIKYQIYEKIKIKGELFRYFEIDFLTPNDNTLHSNITLIKLFSDRNWMTVIRSSEEEETIFLFVQTKFWFLVIKLRYRYLLLISYCIMVIATMLLFRIKTSLLLSFTNETRFSICITRNKKGRL